MNASVTIFSSIEESKIKVLISFGFRAKSSSVFTVDVEDVQAKGRGNAVQ